jgi:hypothetical protein
LTNGISSPSSRQNRTITATRTQLIFLHNKEEMENPSISVLFLYARF